MLRAGTTVALANPAVDTDEAVGDIAAGAWLRDLQRHVAEEMWQWDAQGYCIARGVMDEEWLGAANAALDTYRSDPSVVREIGDSELWQEPDCSNTLRPVRYLHRTVHNYHPLPCKNRSDIHREFTLYGMLHIHCTEQV